MPAESHSDSPPLLGDRLHLTPEHHQLLKSALGPQLHGNGVNADPRSVIREILNGREPATKPEQFLVAFKNTLNEVATTARVPVGPERNTRLAGLVSAFIQEMYASGLDIGDGACLTE